VSGRRVDLYATVARPEDATKAIARAARERISQAAREETRRTAAQPSPTTTVATASDDILNALDGSDEITASSLYVYRLHVARHLRKSTLGQTALVDVRVTDVTQYLSSLAAESGVATARHGRAIVRRTFRWALDAGIRTTDPTFGARIVAPRNKVKKSHLDHARALTKPERTTLAWSVARDQSAVELDLRDLVLAGLAIGGRIGELCALTWSRVTFLDDGRALVHLDGTIDRQTGRGLVRTDSKTPASVRDIPLPRRVGALLRRRARTAGLAPTGNLSGVELPVFPAPGRSPGTSSRIRDRSNTSRALRATFDRAGFTWLSFHGLRRSAVTALGDVLPIRQVADYAGHASIRTTLESYVGRAPVSDEVSRHL
jgi:integrase